MAVILMRHTRPVLDKTYCYGSLDVALADSFETDADNALVNVPRVDQIVSSPLTRARALAERIAATRNLGVHIDPRLSEMNFADWEGRLWSEIPREALDVWAADFLDARPHGGESVRTFQQRCLAAVTEWASHEGDTLIVCHAGVVRAVCARGTEAGDFDRSIGYGETVQWHP
ncbi:MAG: histidine phosphatase family protein [Pseudomonadota bacterium]